MAKKTQESRELFTIVKRTVDSVIPRRVHCTRGEALSMAKLTDQDKSERFIASHIVSPEGKLTHVVQAQ